MEKNAAKNQRFLDFPCPIPTTVQKGSASNRLPSSYRCRSRAPRGDAPVCYRAVGLLRPYRRFPEYRRTQIDAPRRGRRPRRPAARSFHASGGNISRSGATSFCPRRQKDAKTPPKTHGLWNSFTPNVIRRKKAHKESLPLLSPLPLPRTARVACYDRLRYSATRAAAAPTFRTKTFFSRAVWEKHFTLSVYFYIPAAQRAAPTLAAAGGKCAI